MTVAFLLVYWFIAGVALLWVDERWDFDLTDGDPLLAGMYVLMAPALAPFLVLAGVLWLIGATMLRVASLFERSS